MPVRGRDRWCVIKVVYLQKRMCHSTLGHRDIGGKKRLTARCGGAKL